MDASPLVSNVASICHYALWICPIASKDIAVQVQLIFGLSLAFLHLRANLWATWCLDHCIVLQRGQIWVNVVMDTIGVDSVRIGDSVMFIWVTVWGAFSLPQVCDILNMVSAFTWLFPALYSTLKLYHYKDHCYKVITHHASFGGGSFRLFTHFKGWWSVISTNLCPNRYCWNCLIDQIITGDSFSVVACCVYVLVSCLLAYAITFWLHLASVTTPHQ